MFKKCRMNEHTLSDNNGLIEFITDATAFIIRCQFNGKGRNQYTFTFEDPLIPIEPKLSIFEIKSAFNID
jgi:hypothetical protein